MTDIHTKAFQFIQSHQIFGAQVSHSLTNQLLVPQRSVSEQRGHFEGLSKQTNDLIKRAAARQALKKNILVEYKQIESKDEIFRYPLTQNSISLVKEFLRIEQLYLDLCTDKNRVKSTVLPQSNYISLQKFSKEYEQRYNKLFNFIALKKILAVSDAFFKVKILKDSVSSNDMNNYYIELHEFGSVQEYLSYNPEKQTKIFEMKMHQFLKNKHDEFCTREGIYFDYSVESNWLFKFDPDRELENLSYSFSVLDDYSDFIIQKETTKVESNSCLLSNKAKVDLIRERILDKLKKRNDELFASPTEVQRPNLCKDMLIDVAEKLHALLAIRKVSSIYLATVVNHFEGKGCLKFTMDSQEIVGSIKKISLIIPTWLKVIDYKGSWLLKIMPEFSANQVIKYIKSHYKVD